MPFLRDEGPPVSKDTIQRARETLPLEYGFQLVNETGREVLLVRVPKAKPDYLHDLGDVAFYVSLETIRSCKDVLLVGHEKTARLEPQLLRDNIRAQDREDVDLVTDLRRRLGRDYGQSILQSPSNHQHQAFAVRIPKATVSEFSPDDVKQIRGMIESQRARFEACQYAYIVADKDHERLGRRVLMDLLGAPAQAPAQPAAPLAPAAEPMPAAPSVSSLLAHLPATPGAAPAAPAATAAPAPSGGALPGFLAAHMHSDHAAAPAAAPAPVAAALPPTPTPAPVPPPAPVVAPPAPGPAPSAPTSVEDHEEYAIISKPKAAPAAPRQPRSQITPTIAANAPEGSQVKVEDEYEIVAKPKPVEPAPAPAAAAAPVEPDPERKVSKATEEFEVYTSKPRAREAPSITPPGQGGFQAALNAATSTTGHAPMKTKQYEIMGGAPAPQSAPIARALAKPADDPRVQAPLPARAPVAPPPTPDNGAPIVATIAPAAPELLLAGRFKEAGYEVVEGLRAQGTQFAFAAHKPNGRRVLLKRAADFGADDAGPLAQLVAALGADICIVVADKVAPGTRLATWGTRIEVYTPADAAALAF